MKDLFPRYKTMTGHYCLRKGGWDTHGLPVEVEVCKELGIHSKEEIEAYGVEPFNRKCLESVFRYTKEWEDLTRRLGFWINLDEAYVTYHQSYVESVWWALKTLFDAGLLYQGHKIVWWWAQGGTALSAGEVGQGYREVSDPSVFVRFPLVNDDRYKALFSRDPMGSASPENAKPSKNPNLDEIANISLLVWTTTPWTLLSNTFAAVHADFDYALVCDQVDGERLILAKELVPAIAKKLKATDRWEIERVLKGDELLDLRYVPPFRELYYDIVPPLDMAAYYDHEPVHPRPFPRPCLKPWSEAKGVLKGQTIATHYVAWRVVHAGFVTLESGTGLVHEAPAFGDVDFDLLKKENYEFAGESSIPLFCPVGPNGRFEFNDYAPSILRPESKERIQLRQKYTGRWVKDCDKDICRDMKERGVLIYQEQYRHDYPFCWRAEEDPLIQYPRKSWFIRTTQFKDDMLENNSHINWLPEHIKAGRFGKFLESNVDWSLSRERYWGTPLPIWICQSCGHTEAIDSYDALLAKPGVQGLEVWETAKKNDPQISEHLKVHKPYIDALTYDCPVCADQSPDREGAVHTQHIRPSHSRPNPSLTVGAPMDSPGSECRMQRVPEVIDCWFDSGAMPFAQWGYPHQNAEMFTGQFPADFISEALDQTRGWFYSLTAISVMLFGRNGVARDNPQSPSPNPQSAIRNPQSDYPHPFKTCIVLGLLMGEDGQKMSKSKKNYKEPGHIFEHEGADAMRWLFFSGQTPWTSIRFQEAAIAEGQREFLIRLYNCYSFFVIYANIDRWTPDQQPTVDRHMSMDCWIISELNQCCADVFRYMEAYDNFNAAKALIEFVDALSNWYVRRNRERFWKAGLDDDKKTAYATLHQCLVTVSKLIAPFTPFLAESLYQNLVRSHDPDAPDSVHLCDYPITDANKNEINQRIDQELNDQCAGVRQLVSCGRAARSAATIRVRQPLAAIELHHRRPEIVKTHEDIIKDELNIKRIDYVSSEEIDKYVHYALKPDFSKIGPKYGPLAPKIKAALAKNADIESLVKAIEENGKCAIDVAGQTVELAADEVIVELHAKEGYTAERVPGCGILVLDTHITPELRDEGIARDLINQIQQARKKLDLRYEQRIDLAIVGDQDIGRVVSSFGKYVMGETLAQAVLNQPIPDVQPIKTTIKGHDTAIYVKPL
jgi:isoleucyl-tRNA synthetase